MPNPTPLLDLLDALRSDVIASRQGTNPVDRVTTLAEAKARAHTAKVIIDYMLKVAREELVNATD